MGGSLSVKWTEIGCEAANLHAVYALFLGASRYCFLMQLTSIGEVGWWMKDTTLRGGNTRLWLTQYTQIRQRSTILETTQPTSNGLVSRWSW